MAESDPKSDPKKDPARLREEALELAAVCEESLGKYVALRSSLLGTLPLLKEKSPIGEVWGITYKRKEAMPTDFGTAPPRTQHAVGGAQITYKERTFEGNALFSLFEHFGAVEDIALYDKDGNRPAPDSLIGGLERKIAFCLTHLLDHHKVVDDGLFRLAIILAKGSFLTDATPLVELRTEFPHFPYCPQKPFTKEEGEALLLAQEPYLRAARVTLQKIVVEGIAATDAYKPHLNEKEQEALAFIKASPGKAGKEIAKAIGLTSDHFRGMVAKLKAHGVTNQRDGTGYFWEPK